MPIVKVGHATVVLHHQRSARRHKIQQLFVIRGHIFLRVVGPNPQHDRSVSAQVFAGKLLRRNQAYIHSDLLQHSRNVIARAHDIANLQIMRRLHVHHAHALHRRLVIVKAAQIFPRHQRVAFAKLLTARFQHRPNLRSTFL